MQTLTGWFGGNCGTLIFQQKLKCLLGELVSMVSLQWKPFVVVGLLKLRAALFVVVNLKVLTMPFFVVPFQHRFSIFGQTILFTLMASTNPFLIPQYSLSHAILQDLEIFFAIAWAIWINKNKIVHKDSSLLPFQVWQLEKNVSEDFVSSITWDIGQPRCERPRPRPIFIGCWAKPT